jgi:hypothetical protein
MRRSLEQRGLRISLRRSVLLPFHLFQEYRTARKQDSVAIRSHFDRAYDVDTDGEIEGWTHLSDLDIPSANWIHGRNYSPIDSLRFGAALSSLSIMFEDIRIWFQTNGGAGILAGA